MFIFAKGVTVLVRLPNTRKKSYFKTLINASSEDLKRSKHCSLLRLANVRKAANFKFNEIMSQIEHGIECTPVTDANMSVSKTSTCHAFTPFFLFTFHV